MAQTMTLQCTGGTFLSYRNPSSDLSGLSDIPTCLGFLGNSNEVKKRELASYQSSQYYDHGGALLEFESNADLPLKNIRKVTLIYTIAVTGTTTYSTYLRHWSMPGEGVYGEFIGAYISNESLANINYNNYKLVGSESALIYTGLGNDVDFNVASYQRYADVTDAYKRYFSGQKSRFIISTGENSRDDRTVPDNYLNIPYVCAHYQVLSGDYDYNEYVIAKSSASLVVEYENIPPNKPTLTSPVGLNFVANEPIPFTWSYSSPVSSPQASATIEYKLASASTWTTATSSGSGTTWTLSAGLSAGSYQWRVKVTDEQGATSDYSDTKTFSIVALPAPTPTYPVDTGLAAYAPIDFTWTFNKPSSASSTTQAGATLQYRERGSNIWIEEEITGSSTTWTLSAGLSIGQYEWRVKVENEQGEISSYCNIVYFQIVAQSVPTPVSPGDNITLFEGHAVVFNWIYNSLTPATQASATIKYRVVGGSTWTTYTSASLNPFCSISDIPQGQYEWCLNVTNNYGETSADSSTLEFNIIGRPQRPIITTPANCCLTTISWNASGQEAAEFILMQGDDILIHETVATAVTSYKPQMFLKGTYMAMARIKNNSDLWSDYGELEFTIDAATPTAGTLIAMPFDTEIKLEGTYTSNNAAIVRIDEDGTENVISMTATATDKKVASGLEYAYVLRCWDSGGYVDTPTKVFTFGFEGSIFTTDTEELHLDRSEQKFLAHDEEIERQYAQMRYVGREFPVIERGEYTEQTLTKQFHVTKAQRMILDRMAKEKALFYRDSRGNAFKAAILGVSYTNYMADDYIATIKLTRTAADEVIINV